MNKKRIVLGLFVLLQFFSSSSLLCAADDGDTLLLNDFYEQNGDCYLLIGNARNETKSGVYQLNNLNSNPTKKLYSPGNAYGITAGLKLTTRGELEKSLYTFVSKDKATRNAKGRVTTRPMLTTYSYGTWQSDNNTTPNNVAPSIVHRYHTLPNDASTGVGNHTSGYGLYKFNYKCIPCSIAPVADGYNDDGERVYKYKIGEEWYHTVDHPAYSRYTYCTKGTYWRFSSTGYPDIWMADDYSTRSANDPDWYWWSTRYGGWVHYVAKEDVVEETEKLWLQTWIVDHGFDSSLEKKITDVVIGAKSSMSLKGECIDGCISDVDNISLPGEPAPHLDTAYSAQTKASYVYTRDRGSDKGKIEGLQTDLGDIVVGDANTMTTKFVGISSRSDTGNYVYLLGSDVINRWLTDLSCPASMLISDPEDLADIAVSDQWWQNGGIVYAYDKAKKKVYCFVRNEKLGKSDPPTEINADLGGGRLPDKIGADGFGALYLMKTDFKPDTRTPLTYFAGTGKNSAYGYTISGYDRGRPVFRALYKQDIVKSVYKKPYGSDVDPERLAEDVTIDTNYYFRDYQTPSDTYDDPVKIYSTPVMVQSEVNDLSGDYRSELAVINCPTPPRPDHVKAVCDNNGPMIYDKSTHMYAMAPRRDDGYFPSDTLYYFMVENAPYFDSNLVNIGNTDVDIDSDGKIGRFPNTVKNESVEYYWQVRRIVDRDGNKVDEYAEENQVLEGSDGSHIVKGNYIMSFPSLLDKGTYKVGVKVTYRFYDYSKLPVGALASQKEKCLSALKVATALPAAPADHPEDEGFSWETIEFMPVEPPPSIDGDGVIMTSVNGDAEKSYLPGEACSGCSHQQCENTLTRMNNPVTPTFILDSYSICKSIQYKLNEETGEYEYVADWPDETRDTECINWGIKLRENTYNLKTRKLDRTVILCGEPPDPHDPSMIEGTLRWLTPKDGDPKVNDLKVHWSSSLQIGDKVETFNVTTPGFTLSIGDIRKLFPVPSEPICYTLSVRADSSYTYSFMDYGPRRVAGGKIVYDYHRADNPVSISISATAKVCVADNQKPSYMVYDAGTGNIIPGYALEYSPSDKDYVKATSGETISESDSGKKLVFYVADNNPFANYNGTRECTGEGKFHYNGSDRLRNRLRVRHSLANRKAFLYNENCSHSKVDTGASSTSPEEVNGADIDFSNITTSMSKGTEITAPSRLVAFTKYVFDASKLGKFTGTDAAGNAMSFDYASDKPGYTNLKFGIRWKESSGLEVSEEDFKGMPSYSIGNIVSVDNDRPNIFITAKQEKFVDEFTVPTVTYRGTKYGSWFPTVNPGPSYSTQGPDIWDLKKSESNPPTSYFDNSLLENNSFDELTKELFVEDKALLADIPVTFEVSANDNAGNITFESIRIIKLSDESVYAGPSTDFPPLDNKKIQCVFRDRDETQYCVEATVADDARTWPDNAEDNASDDSLIRNENRNRRTIKAYFRVVPSRLDFRVLDREIRH